MQSVNIKYQPAVDHLRFYAAFLVMVYHGILVFNDYFVKGEWYFTDNPFLAPFAEGHTAVSMFMVLSGFIFAYGAFGKKIKYLGFIKNRFLRIYPLFIFLIIIGLIIYPENFDALKLIQSVFWMANLPGGISLGPISTMFWTISVEFQFYLVFPFLMGIAAAYGNRPLVAIIAIVIIARWAAWHMGVEASLISYWTLLGRLDQFIIGMLGAIAFLSFDRKKTKKLFLPALIGVFAMSFAGNRLGGAFDQGFWRVLWPAVEALGWVFVIVSYTALIGESTNLASRTLSKFGEYSYSMYLLHFNIWYLLIKNKIFIDLGFGPVANSFFHSILMVLPLTLIVSSLTFNLIEKPFLKLRGRYLNAQAGKCALTSADT